MEYIMTYDPCTDFDREDFCGALLAMVAPGSPGKNVVGIDTEVIKTSATKDRST